MPFVPVANVALAEIRMSQDLQQVENTLYFRFSAPPTVAQLDALGARLLEWWITDLAPHIVNGVTLREIVCTDLTSATGPQFTTVPPTLTQGGNLAGGLANSITLTASFRTANRGRSFRGRNYVVGLSVSDMLGQNTVKDSTITAVITAYDALTLVALDTSSVWVVVSRFSGVDASGKPIPRTTGISTPINATVVVDNVVDNQRRRLPKRGS